ncbi:MAG: ugtP 1 [Firmicutes bacterium]|nr:ugtP 1 [Bacillota bacterium]
MSAEGLHVLLVSASVGSGHDQAAKAVAAGIERWCPAARVEIVDFMGLENSYVNTVLKEAYLKVIDVSPNLYDLVYRWTQMPRRYIPVQSLVARAMKRAMLRLYRQYSPDLVICTHPFPLSAAAYLKKTYKLQVPLVGVMTDFSVHPLWVSREVTSYFVATKAMRQELITQGIAPWRIHATGIPIQPSFSEVVDGKKVRKELGLDPSLSTVLFMGGGLGLGPIDEAVKAISQISRLQMIVVAGKNEALKKRLDIVARFSDQRMAVVGYTKRIGELMAAADVLVTKPGALTLSEAMACGLPMVLYSTLPGQEMENASFCVNHGAAVQVEDMEALPGVISHLLRRPEKLAALKRSSEALGRKDSADSVAKVIYELMKTRLVAGV